MNIMTNKEYRNRFGETIDIKSINDKYFNNWKIKDIAKYHKCSHQQITKIIWKEFIHRRDRIYKWEIDHLFFNNINTEFKAYILGFLCADGCVSKKSNTLSIGLQIIDIDIIEKIKSHLKSNSPMKIHSYKNKQYVSINFYSKEICESLKHLGCVPLKSEHLKWIDKIPDDLIRHFVRGYCDGDGHIGFWFYKNKYLKSTVSFTSTLDFCHGLKNLISTKLEINCYTSQRNKKVNPESNNRTIEISGNKQNLKLLNWMYKDCNIFLNRKKNKYDEFIKLYDI